MTTSSPKSAPPKPKPGTLQERTLDALCAQGGSVVIFTLNGSRIMGRICGYDANTVLIESDVLKLVYKSTIASILPEAPARDPRS